MCSRIRRWRCTVGSFGRCGAIARSVTKVDRRAINVDPIEGYREGSIRRVRCERIVGHVVFHLAAIQSAEVSAWNERLETHPSLISLSL